MGTIYKVFFNTCAAIVLAGNPGLQLHFLDGRIEGGSPYARAQTSSSRSSRSRSVGAIVGA